MSETSPSRARSLGRVLSLGAQSSVESLDGDPGRTELARRDGSMAPYVQNPDVDVRPDGGRGASRQRDRAPALSQATRVVTVPPALAGWHRGDRPLPVDLDPAGIEELHVLGTSGIEIDSRTEALRALGRLPALRVVSFDACDPADRERVARLGELFGEAGVAVTANYVLAGLEAVHDGVRGSLPAFGDTLHAVEALRASRDRAARVLVPLWPETIESAFDLWHILVREAIPFVVTIGRVDRYSGDQRYKVMELLENLSRHEVTPPGLRYRYAEMRRQLENGLAAQPGEAPIVAADSRDYELVERALADGLVPPPVIAPSTRWRLACWARSHKLDKWALVLRGMKSLAPVSMGWNRHVAAAPATRPEPHILVVGWYGTETAGDKAILGGILKGVQERSPGMRATVVSRLPFYTRRTIEELGLTESVRVVPLDLGQIRRLIPDVGLVIVGGGPLMDLVEMFDVFRILALARDHRVPSAIAGCGIGPARWPSTRRVIRKMIELSSATVLRDEASVALLRQWSVDTSGVRTGRDPALAYLAKSPRARKLGDASRPVLGMAVREWQWKFGRDLGKKDFEAQKAELVDVWAAMCDWFVETYDGEVHLIPMHTLHIGGDDRWFQADVKAAVQRKDRVVQHTSSYSALAIAERLRACDLVVAMRYHAVLFSAIDAVPLLAIDYTLGGKISAFMKETGMSEWLFDLGSLELGDVQSTCERLWLERAAVRTRLQGLRAELVEASDLAAATVASRLLPGGGA